MSYLLYLSLSVESAPASFFAVLCEESTIDQFVYTVTNLVKFFGRSLAREGSKTILWAAHSLASLKFRVNARHAPYGSSR